ncbi:hypothetical protein GCM10023176_12260 [Micromonospora coerulea]|uniref:RAMA domain-containing protein n=1 Tax=Micromonospora coerulea TaxID=47856 RepID=A0ABP8SBP5_9ACTN
MRKIDIDDEVFELLQRNARPFIDTENDVLRRLLLSEGGSTSQAQPVVATSPGTPAGPGSRGDLLPFIEQGLLLVGDKLVHTQPRRGLVHRAIVTADGCIETADGARFKKPSPALKSCLGHEINGWSNWTVERTGRTLYNVRAAYRQKTDQPEGQPESD